MVVPINNRNYVGEAFSWMSTTLQATPAKVTMIAGAVWTKMAALPGAVSKGWNVTRTWFHQKWASFTLLVAHVYASVSAFFQHVSNKIHEVLAHHVVQSVLQKIKSTILAAWSCIRKLPTQDKVLYGSLLLLGLWSGILPWILKFALGCTLSLAATILPMIFVPLAFVGLAYLAYTRGWFSSLPSTATVPAEAE
jgi:hypothetical protein